MGVFFGENGKSDSPGRNALPVRRLVGVLLHLGQAVAAAVDGVACRSRASRVATPVGARLRGRGDSPHGGHD